MKNFSGGFGPILQHPIAIIVIASVLFNAVLLGMGIISLSGTVAAIIVFIIDILATVYLLDRLVYFFSQFVLPIQNPNDRNEIYKRVKVFEEGRGPTLFVKNGRVIEHEGEADKRGRPGLIVLDTASAIVLRTDTEITGSAGPGIRFIAKNEYVAGSVDLRAQWKFVGPLANEQPFYYPMPLTDQEQYNELENKRKVTLGHTRDAIEVSPTISIKFKIKRPDKIKPDASGVTSHYGFDEESVENAITHEVVNLGKNKSIMGWYQLPSELVINIWREYVRKFKLEDLFTTKGVSGLQKIEEMINKRVTEESVPECDDTGEPTGRIVPSPEYEQLFNRGLQITEVRIHNVLIDPKMEDQLIQQWDVDWMKVARDEEKFLNEKERLIETTAREYASKNFARIATSKFDNPSALPRDQYSTLMDLIDPFKEAILENGAKDDSQLKKLEEIWKWLLVNNFERTNRMDQGKPS